MKVIIDKEKCTGCKICVNVCPQIILEVVDKICHVKDIDHCMGCFGCEIECKEGAIKLLRAPQGVKEIEIEPPPKEIKECDVAIVGGGPAGLGAAITCARAGLDVVVFDKLPSRQLSHHNDGGVMFTLSDVTSVNHENNTIKMPELDISLDGSIASKLSYIGMLGPDGLSSRNDFPKDLDGFIQNKTLFLKELCSLAENAGAKLWYNAKVVDILKDGNRVCGVQLDTGEEITSKVVVTADGIFADMSEKAGFPINREEPWYTCGIRYQFDKDTQTLKNLPMGYHYIFGDLEPGDEMAAGYSCCLASISVVDTIHIGLGFMTQKKNYPAPKPLEHYVKQFIKNDTRLRNIFGSELDGKKPTMMLGFRVRFRKEHLKDRVGEGVICVGDAWVDDSDMGNIPALGNGVHAGRTIVNAAKKGDFSKAALEPANEFASKQVLGYLARSKKEKLATTVLNEEELEEYFRYLPHFHYPAILFGGSKHKTIAFTKYMIGNTFRFFKLGKYPNLKNYVLG